MEALKYPILKTGDDDDDDADPDKWPDGDKLPNTPRPDDDDKDKLPNTPRPGDDDE